MSDAPVIASFKAARPDRLAGLLFGEIVVLQVGALILAAYLQTSMTMALGVRMVFSGWDVLSSFVDYGGIAYVAICLCLVDVSCRSSALLQGRMEEIAKEGRGVDLGLGLVLTVGGMAFAQAGVAFTGLHLTDSAMHEHDGVVTMAVGVFFLLRLVATTTAGHLIEKRSRTDV